MPKRSIVAERIEELLRIKGLSVADLSRTSGVTESALSNILSGTRKQPRADTIQKIAKAFPTSTDYLNGYTSNHEPANAPDLPEYASDVLESMRQLDPARNYELLLIAQSFVEENKQIRRLAIQEVIDFVVAASDELGSEEDTDRILEMLQRLERGANQIDRDDDNLLPPPLH